jgi:hypothetical protein
MIALLGTASGVLAIAQTRAVSVSLSTASSVAESGCRGVRRRRRARRHARALEVIAGDADGLRNSVSGPQLVI